MYSENVSVVDSKYLEQGERYVYLVQTTFFFILETVINAHNEIWSDIRKKLKF